MKHLLRLCFWLACFAAGFSAKAQETFDRTYRITDGRPHEGAGCIVTDGDGYLALVNSSGALPETWLIRTNTYGDTLWTRRISPDSLGEKATCLINGKGNRIYAIGYRTRGKSSLGIVSALNLKGDLVWSKNFGADDQSLEFHTGTLCENGDVLATGVLRTGPGRNNYFFQCVLMGPDGNVIWNKTLRIRLGTINGVRETAEGDFVFTGYQLDFHDTSGSMFLMKWNNMGESVWTQKYFGEGWATGSSVQPVAGGYLLAGNTTGSAVQASHPFLVGTDRQGQVLWKKVVSGAPENEQVKGSCVLKNGNIVLAGLQQGNIQLSCIDSTGMVLWRRQFGNGDQRLNAFSRTDDGGFVLCGTADAASLPVAHLVRTDSLGRVLNPSVNGLLSGNHIRFTPLPANRETAIQPFILSDVVLLDLPGYPVKKAGDVYQCLDFPELKAGCYLVQAKSLSGKFLYGLLLVAP